MTRRVVFSEDAQADIDELYDWIADRVGPGAAGRYLDRIRRRREQLDMFPLQGTARDDLAPSLRTFGIERRVLVAFSVKADRVVIVRVPYGGRNIDAILRASDELE